MNRRTCSLIAGAILALHTGCAHQREPVFAPTNPGMSWGSKPTLFGKSTPSNTKTANTKTKGVEQSARANDGEPFDFDQVE